MINRRNRITALLLSFMMIALNLFSGTEALYAYAETDADSQTITEEAAGTEQAEDTADAEEEEQAETPKEEAAPAEEAAQEEAAPVEETEEEAEEEVAFSDEETLDGVTIKVTADEGVFPEGAELEVRDLTAKEEKDAKKAIDEITDEKADTEYLFDISVQKDGKEIEPEGDVKVSFETEEVADDNLKAEVIHVKDNGKAEELAVKTKGEVATIETDSFSPYSLRLIYNDPYNPSASGEYDIAISTTWTSLDDVIHSIGFASTWHVTNAQADANQNVVQVDVYDSAWYVKALNGDPGNTHGIELMINNGIDTKKVNLNVATHTHNWVVEKSDPESAAEWTITCTNDYCAYHAATYKASISASDATYNGQGHPATKTIGSLPTSDVAVSDIYYEGTNGTTYAATTTAPTNAGSYRAWYTVNGKAVETTFSIAKANISITTAPIGYTLTYNGESRDMHDNGVAKDTTTGETFAIRFADGNDTNKDHFSTSHIHKTNAGTYTISYYAKGDNNHNDTAIGTFTATINRRPVTIDGVTATSKVYDGTDAAHLNTSGLVISNNVDGGNLTVSVTGTYRSDSTQGIVGKNVGTGKVIDLTYVLNGTKKDNYTIDTTSVYHQRTTSANITKKNIEPTWDEATELQYTGDFQAPIAHLMKTSVINDNDKKIYAIDEGKVSVTVTGKKKLVGTDYKAYVGVLEGTEAGNYNLINTNTPAEFSIIPKELTVVWTKIEKEYNAEGLEPDWSLTGFVGEENPTKTLTLTANPTPLKDGTAYNAGKYQATVTLSGEDAGNYTITNPTSDFTITKAPLTVKAKGWVYYGTHVKENSNDWINELEYDEEGTTGFKGNDGTEVLTAIRERTVRFDSNYEFTDPATGVTNPKTGKAAKYYLYPEFEQAANYEITNADGELTVYPKPVKLEWTHEHAGQTEAVSGDQTFVYDGKLHKYTAKVSEDSYVYNPSGLPADREITVTLTGNEQSYANVKTETEKYTAFAAELSNPNYALVEISEDGTRTPSNVATRGQDFFIDQLPIELSWKPAEFTYNAQSQRPTATIENLQTDDNGKKDDEFEITFTPAPAESINADNYTATVTDLADKNYSELAKPTDPESALVPTGTFAYTIKKAPLSIKSIAKTITYRDEAPKASEYELDVAGAGLQGDDTIENIGLNTSSLEFSCSYRKNDKPGSYAVVPSMDAQTLVNYTVNLEDGTLQVNDKSLGLVARGLAKGKKKGALAWNGVTGATSYEVWMAPCSSKSFKRVATVGGTSYVTKKLKKNKFYKFYIVANTPYGRIYSSQSHFCTGNKAKKLTNAKSLKINAGSVGLNKGDSFTIGKSAKKAKKKLKFPGAKHGGNFRFMSDNPEVATVNGAGTITAVGSGWCRVYTQTTNGIWQVTEVYVY